MARGTRPGETSCSENGLHQSHGPTSAVGVSVTRDGDRARLEVVDDGPGIPADELSHVFERRFKASTAPVRRQVGTGLGLAIAREMVQAMGGTITLANEPGGGARVTIELTVVAPD